MKQNDKRYLLFGFIIAAITFILIFVGVKFVLSNPINLNVIIAYIVLSLIFGGISSALYYFKLKAVYKIFCIGIAVGFFDMYRIFIDGVDGWGDLAGLLSLFAWVLLGFVAGLTVQLIIYIKN